MLILIQWKKISISSYEDKRCYKQTGIDSFACGHYNINTIMRNNNVNIIWIIITYIITNLSEEDKANLDVIEAVFYDDEYGYGSKLNTLKTCKTNKSKYNYVWYK